MSSTVALPDFHPLRARGLQPLWLMVVLAAVSAPALYAAFPPLEVWQLAWVALVPLMLALSQLRPTQGLLAGWLFGAVFMACLNAYMGMYGVMRCCLGALFWGCSTGSSAPVYRRWRRCQTLPCASGLPLRYGACGACAGACGPLAYTFGLTAIRNMRCSHPATGKLWAAMVSAS